MKQFVYLLSVLVVMCSCDSNPSITPISKEITIPGKGSWFRYKVSSDSATAYEDLTVREVGASIAGRSNCVILQRFNLVDRHFYSYDQGIFFSESRFGFDTLRPGPWMAFGNATGVESTDSIIIDSTSSKDFVRVVVSCSKIGEEFVVVKSENIDTWKYLIANTYKEYKSGQLRGQATLRTTVWFAPRIGVVVKSEQIYGRGIASWYLYDYSLN